MQRDFVIIAAMAEEIAPIIDAQWRQQILASKDFSTSQENAHNEQFNEWRMPEAIHSFADIKLYSVKIAGTKGWAVLSGIGMSNAAAKVATLIAKVQPKAIFYSGTAGGLAAKMRVGNVVIGNSYAYHDADASAFGYQLGQIPGLPAQYNISSKMQDVSDKLINNEHCVDCRQAVNKVYLGQIVSGNSFVTDKNVEHVRSNFPDALAVDMESAAAMQISWQNACDFLSIRCVSDLCMQQGDMQFHINVHYSACTAAHITLMAVQEYLAL